MVPDDPQRKLVLPKPKLPNGQCPDGFLDYAVNLINLDSKNLSCVTTNGLGLRETLFYSLFSRLQIYKTRTEMLQALPCITEGALSLDGGMIRKSGVFSLGSRFTRNFDTNLTFSCFYVLCFFLSLCQTRYMIFCSSIMETLLLYCRNDVEVKFPVASGGSDVPANYTKSEEMIRMMKWERANIAADMKRERALMDYAKIQH